MGKRFPDGPTPAVAALHQTVDLRLMSALHQAVNLRLMSALYRLSRMYVRLTQELGLLPGSIAGQQQRLPACGPCVVALPNESVRRAYGSGPTQQSTEFT